MRNRSKRQSLFFLTVFACALVTLPAALPALAVESYSCIEMLEDPIFDTSDDCTQQPERDRVLGSQVLKWGDSAFLLTNVGNEIRMWNIDDPLNPVDTDESEFRVGNVGDSDYDLMNFSICDDCRYGVASYKRGTVLFDLGEGAAPRFGNDVINNDANLVYGAFTFVHDGQQYLIATGLTDQCETGDSTLYTFDGINEATDLGSPSCVDAEGIDQTHILGGVKLGDYLYLGDSSQRVFVFHLVEGASGLEAEYVSTPMNAYMIQDSALAADPDRGLMIEANSTGMHLWDVSDPSTPIELGTAAGSFNRAAIAYPLAFVARKGFRNSEMTYDISNPAAPVPFDEDFWGANQPWNNVDSACGEIRGATFSPDGTTLYLSRYAFLQIANFASCAMEPEADFTYEPELPVANQSVQFWDASLHGVESWAWDFGDGAISTLQNPLHTYGAAGTYTVTLEVENAFGTSTASKGLVVGDEPVSTATRLYFPAAAAAEGANDSYWQTDVEINNRSSVAASYVILFLERGEDNTEAATAGPFSLAPGKGMRYPNVVGDLFAQEGAGALAVEFSEDVDAVLSSRTFNTFSDGTLEGTFGQAIPAVHESSLIGANQKVRLIQLSQDDQFRTNLGFMNGSDRPIRVFVEFFLADGSSLGQDFQDLQPYSNMQWNEAFTKITENDVADGYVDVWTETPGGHFTTYASIVGNDDFNDPTTVLPQ